VQPLIMLAENITEWFKSQAFYDYFNWLLAQPSADYTGVLLVIGVIVAGLLIVVVMK
jgi:hypothetical protein